MTLVRWFYGELIKQTPSLASVERMLFYSTRYRDMPISQRCWDPNAAFTFTCAELKLIWTRSVHIL